MDHERLCQIALSNIKKIGPVHAKSLVGHFGSASAIFAASQYELENLEGIGSVRAGAIARFNGFSECEKTLKQAENQGLELLFLSDPAYPRLLLECNDPPTLLYCKGKADLNVPRMVAVVGTRRCSDYGRHQTEKLIRELAGEQVTIVSGMAYGIDGVAHKTALEAGLPTIGVMAHGLHTVYPPQHYSLSREMIKHNGALISEFHPGIGPEMHHFPVRNRIVAGICKAAIVVETRVDGGSMGTAKFAFDYHRDVFAFPGKVTDIKSSGCNLLINKLKASLITGADSFIEAMRWQDERLPEKQNVQLPLFSDIDPEATTIVNLLGIHGTLPIDELYLRSGVTATKVASIVLQLELTGMLKCLPGKRYRLR